MRPGISKSPEESALGRIDKTTQLSLNLEPHNAWHQTDPMGDSGVEAKGIISHRLPTGACLGRHTPDKTTLNGHLLH